ncbi:hypothetical protein [Luteolibacter sp. LG18]|uniref:hypothetical protein n=1 Tax=Luteolibacter sp. LG18 TaxID=2819286 RepID=UPI002B28FC8D|nr:hypothetical protein llg_36110 [Luteolibacter sp. LG18]
MKAFLFELRISGRPTGRVVVLADDRREAIEGFVEKYPDGEPQGRSGFVCEEIPWVNGSAFSLG